MRLTVKQLREYIRDVLSPEKADREQIELAPCLDMDPHLEDDMNDYDLGPVPPSDSESDAYHVGLDPFNKDWSVLPTRRGGSWNR